MKRKHQDRKDRIDEVHEAARKLCGSPACLVAWTRLCRYLDEMTLPDAPPPRFHGLLNAIELATTTTCCDDET